MPPPVLTQIMTAILLTAGPISTVHAYGKNVTPKLRTKKTCYLEAGEELQKLGIVKMTSTVTGTDVIVKMPPKDVWKILEDTGLCPPIRYEARYNSPLPKCVSEIVRNQVVAEGYFDEL